MILVDSSIWIDHFRAADSVLVTLLERGAILTHSFIVGELAMGSLRYRTAVLGELDALPHATEADHDEVRRFIDRYALDGRGIGYIDAHLLAAAHLTHGATLWTRGKRLDAVAKELGVQSAPASFN